MLEKLRSKPEHFKKSFSLFLTILIFSGILFVWLSSWDARMHGQEIRDKTVSPATGVASMFDGLISGFKEKISGTPTYVENTGATSRATTTSEFDFSGVVIIDDSTGSKQGTSTMTATGN